MFLTIWAKYRSENSAKVVLLSLKEYAEALERCFKAFDDTQRANVAQGATRTTIEHSSHVVTGAQREAARTLDGIFGT